MKKLILCIFSFISSKYLFAQQWVWDEIADERGRDEFSFGNLVIGALFIGAIWLIIYLIKDAINAKKDTREKNRQNIYNGGYSSHNTHIEENKPESIGTLSPLSKTVEQDTVERSPIETQEYILSYDKKCFIKNKSEGLVAIPEGVEVIKEFAFATANNIEEVILPNSLKEIEMHAFFSCKIKRISIPSSVSKIGEGAFSYSQLERVIISEGIEYLPKSIFYGCGKLESVKLPASLRNIPMEAFYDCYKIKSIDLPNGIRAIGDSAFSGCISLERIYLPLTVMYLGRYTFQQCRSLKEIVIPEEVIGIPEMCFYDCSDLKKVELPHTLRCIMRMSFGNCYGFKITIPANVDYIDNEAFCQCNDMQIEVPNKLADELKSKCKHCYNLNIKEYFPKQNNEIDEISDKKKEMFLRQQKAKDS